MTEYHFRIVRLAHMQIIGHTYALWLKRFLLVTLLQNQHHTSSYRRHSRACRGGLDVQRQHFMLGCLPLSLRLRPSLWQQVVPRWMTGTDGKGRGRRQRRRGDRARRASGRLGEWNDGSRVERTRQTESKRGEVEKRHLLSSEDQEFG